MMLLPALCGSLVVAGAAAVVLGLRGWADPPGPWAPSLITRVRSRFAGIARLDRIGWAAAAAFVAGILTGWPVAAAVAAVAAWIAVKALTATVVDEAAQAEAIALWAEMLRDELGTSSEIETALRSTAATAPRPIRAEVMLATAKLDYAPLDAVLDELSEVLGGGVGDLVIEALRLAGRSGGRQVREVLDATAKTAYDEAGMLRRIEVARQSPRTSARLVVGITSLTVLGTVVLFRDWVKPYGSTSGQIALAGIALWCGSAIAWMGRMTRVQLPARFVARHGSDL